ncbi:MAG: hypothetical protein CMJ18_02655, partial [Phycisphaeraceae bacterium]|nr:hypothetical protein [Phycisphaeraceae bacterium]
GQFDRNWLVTNDIVVSSTGQSQAMDSLMDMARVAGELELGNVRFKGKAGSNLTVAAQRDNLAAGLQAEVRKGAAAETAKRVASPQLGRQARVERYRQQLAASQDEAAPSDEAPGRGRAAPGAAPAEGAAAVASGWLSLDVDLALRGEEHQFTTPGGDVRVSARAIGRGWIDGLKRVGITILVLLVIVALARVGPRIAAVLASKGGPALLAALGALMVITLTLPVLGLLLFMVAVGVTLYRIQLRRDGRTGG